MLWRRRVEPITRPLVYAAFRWKRGLTLGVRALVTDPENRVLLVEHTYVHGWYMPGGGVERGETAETAVRRELMEEAGVALTEPPRLVSIHSNDAKHPRDHVLFYRCGAWEPCPSRRGAEIHAVGWFALDALPEGTTAATRARLRETFEAAEADPLW